MPNLMPDIFYRRSLPHIQPPGKELFVTFRLEGSIPPGVLHALRQEAERVQAELDDIPPSPERTERLYREQKRLFGKWDEALDSGAGPDYLRKPAVAEVVVENLGRFDRKRYNLLAYCIMPNHVHVVMKPLPKMKRSDKETKLDQGDGQDLIYGENWERDESQGEKQEYFTLAEIMHTMKGYTAGRANRLLGRTGSFWQHESYDHYARDGAELERIVAYVVGNPVKAKMVEKWEDWPWSYATPLAFSR